MSGNVRAESQLQTHARHARTRSLRGVLLAAIASMAMLLVASLLYVGAQSWHEFSAAERLDAANTAGNRLIAGVYELLIERLATNNTLQAEAPGTAEQLRQIEARRKAVEDGFAASLPTLLVQEFPGKPELVTDWNKAHQNAGDLRARADTMLAVGKAQRDPDLLKLFIPGMTELVDASLRLWLAMMHTASQGDPIVTRYASIKQLGWTLRDLSGRERSIIASAIAAGKPIPPDQLQQISGYRAQIQLAWNLTLDLAAADGTAPAIRQALGTARERYFGGFLPLADRLIAVSQSAGSYPMSASDWVGQSTPQIDSLLAIMSAASQASELVTARLKSAALRDLLIAGACLLLACGATSVCFLVVVRRIALPLSRITGVVRALAAGDLDVKLVDARRRDEVGEIARALDVFRQDAIEKRRLAAEQEAARAAKERRQTAMDQHTQDFGASISGVMAALGRSAEEMRRAAATMSDVATRVHEHAAGTAEGSARSSQELTTIAAAIEELTSSVEEVSRQVAMAAQVAREAVQHSESSHQTMRKLTDATARIGEVVGLISDIANQTNLLALNATIEAARAGEAGKGFAVVAGEVKALAAQTGKATGEISGQIEAVRNATDEVVAAIDQVGTTIGRLDAVSAAIAGAVEQQSATTREIAASVQAVSGATDRAARAMSEVAEVAESAGKASHSVLDGAKDIGGQAENLRLEVDHFLVAVRAENRGTAAL